MVEVDVLPIYRVSFKERREEEALPFRVVSPFTESVEERAAAPVTLKVDESVEAPPTERVPFVEMLPFDVVVAVPPIRRLFDTGRLVVEGWRTVGRPARE